VAGPRAEDVADGAIDAGDGPLMFAWCPAYYGRTPAVDALPSQRWYGAMDDPNAQPAPLEPGPIPLLTAVMVMPRSFSILRASLACLRRQSIRRQIELVLVYTAEFESTIDLSDCKDLCSVRLVEIDRLPAVAGGFAAGAAAASAPIVAFVEDHVFLHPEWAERVVEAHRQPCAAVVPKMTNANPATVWSRANFLVSFSEAFAMDRAGPVESGPGHNTSYKRAVLESYRGELATLYQS